MGKKVKKNDEFTDDEIYDYLNNIETRTMWMDIFKKRKIDYMSIIYNRHPSIHHRCTFKEFTKTFKTKKKLDNKRTCLAL